MTNMVDQPRVAKVLVALLSSMTVGAIVLLVLEGRPVPAGAFSLSSYSQLDSVSDALQSNRTPQKGSWKAIEVSYSFTTGGNLQQIASLQRLSSADDLNFHFLICNGRGASNGVITSTERWQKQMPCVQGDKWNGNEFTIRVCIVGDDAGNQPTDSQLQRVATLVETLCHKFEISQRSVRYPDGWKY
jgi:N-acetyl-anhydromuramyl-L-alanine amidase AmpD